MVVRTTPGYKLERDWTGLTKHERATVVGLARSLNGKEIAAELGVSRQRVHAVIKALERKGVVVRSKDWIELKLPRTVQQQKKGLANDGAIDQGAS